MSKFHVTQVDPLEYREQICEYWDRYLPGTPHARLDWLNTGNPAGPAIWFFAFDEQTIAGMISLMPKEMILQGRPVRAAILGDFMINSKYRVFGPNLILPKTALGHVSKLDGTYVYTVPNADSEQLIKRIGLHKVGSYRNLVKPIDARHYLAKYLFAWASRIMVPLVNVALRIASKEPLTPSRGFFTETADLQESMDVLNESAKERFSLLGNRSLAYQRWKYFENPHHHLRMIIYQDDPQGPVQGAIIFGRQGGRLMIYDMLTASPAALKAMVKHIARLARREDCSSITLEIYENNPFISTAKTVGFFDTKVCFDVWSSDTEHWPSTSCLLFAADRNT